MSGIRFAKPADIADIMNYIDENWKKGHILSNNRPFFLYEFQNLNRINFVIHRNNKNAIDGILGFICSSKIPSDIWTVMWMVSPDGASLGLGVKLLLYLKKSDDYRVLSSPGINPQTINIYKFLKMHTGILNHYVMMNATLNEFDIAKIRKKITIKPFNFIASDDYKLIPLNEDMLQFDFDMLKQYVPFKDEDYFIKRYFRHPIYNYNVYAISKGRNNESILVTRNVTVKGKQAVRIVDYLGAIENLKYIAKNLNDKIIENNYEYIDFVCLGFDHKSLLEAGFVKFDLESDYLIIPNYFEPFEQKNKTINYFIDTKNSRKVRIVKADGDQDRPSQAIEKAKNE